jgi:hypothetical protein
MLGVAIGLAMIWRLGPATMLTGGLILLLLGWSARKRHQLANIALLVDESDRLSFIRSTLQAKEAELKRSAIGLALVLPGITLTMLLGFYFRGEADLAAFLSGILLAPRGLLALGFMGCAVALLTWSHLRLRDEAARIRTLWGEYAEEVRQDRGHLHH